MAEKAEKGFSIITNFGCDVGCWYCVWKNHKLRKQTMNTDWWKLERVLKMLPLTKISVSGGGDPFFNLEQNRSWFDKLFEMTKKCRKSVDVHTAKLLPEKGFIRKFSKYVLHVDWTRFNTMKDSLTNFPIPLRLVVVVVPELTKEQMETMIDFSNQIKCQLTFRELYPVKNDFATIKKDYDKLDKRIQWVYQDDYNVYFMPDNKVYDNFLLNRKAIM